MNRPIPPCAPCIEVIFPSKRPSGPSRPLPRLYKCKYDGCTAEFSRFFHLTLHYELKHECPDCGRCFKDINDHFCSQRGAGGIIAEENKSPEDIKTDDFKLKEVIHNGGIYIFEKEVSPYIFDFTMLFSTVRNDLYHISEQYIQIFRGVKFSLTIETTLTRISDKKTLE